MQLLHSKIQALLAWLKNYISKPWYPAVLALLSASDAYLVFIPTDGLVVSSSMGTPKRWFTFAFWSAVGSTLGALSLSYLASHFGLPWIEIRFPELINSSSWFQVNEMLDKFGLLFLFGYSATPLPQQPTALLAGLAEMSFLTVGLSMFAGRLIKFSVMAYAGAKAPWLLKRLWGIKDELVEVGIRPDSIVDSHKAKASDN